MANRVPNHGIYASLIEEYVRHKRSLGYKMEDVEERLRRFDQLCNQQILFHLFLVKLNHHS